jgi:hypothetical protein
MTRGEEDQHDSIQSDHVGPSPLRKSQMKTMTDSESLRELLHQLAFRYIPRPLSVGRSTLERQFQHEHVDGTFGDAGSHE